MAITPLPGYKLDPNNPNNGVVPIDSPNPFAPTQTPPVTPPTVAPAVAQSPSTTLVEDQKKAANQGKPGYDALGNPIASPSTTSSPTTTSPDQTRISTAQAKIDEDNAKLDTAFNTFNTYATAFNAGTVPLTAGEEAQVNSLKAQYQALIDQQKIINTGAQGTASIRGFQKGAAESSPLFQSNIVNTIMSTGVTKLAELSTKMAGAVAALTQSLQQNDYNNVKSQWDELQSYTKDRNAALQKTIDDTQKAIKEAVEVKQKQDEAIAKVEAETVKTKNDVLMKLGQSGNEVPSEVLQAVQNASTPGEAIIAAGNFLYSDADKLDAQYKRAQIAKAYSDIQANNAIGGGDAATTLAYAQQYAATGQIPAGLPKGSFGAVAQVAKELPKSPGQILSTSTGVTPTGDTALQQAMGSLYSATELAKQLKDLDQKRWDGIIAGTLGTVFGSADQKRYDDLRAQVVDLISRARSGAALTSNEEARYESMLPGHFAQPFGLGVDTQVRIDNFINALTSDLKNKAASQGWAVNGISTVKVGGMEYKVGDVIQSASGKQGRINPDGTITLL